MLLRRFFSVVFTLSVFIATCLAKRRIYGGIIGDITHFPWHVALLRNGVQHCGGSILSQFYVLTAAHCVHDVRFINELTIIYGTNRLYDGSGFTVNVVDFTIHPFYNNIIFDNDLAILTLAVPGIQFSNAASPISLRSREAAPGERVSIAGFGLTQSGFNSNILLTTSIQIMDWNTCSNVPRMWGLLTRNMICAVGQGRSTCAGDSGSPVIINRSQVALVSWDLKINGRKVCGHPNNPNVFTNLPNYQEWINANTQNTAQWTFN